MWSAGRIAFGCTLLLAACTSAVPPDARSSAIGQGGGGRAQRAFDFDAGIDSGFDSGVDYGYDSGYDSGPDACVPLSENAACANQCSGWAWDGCNNYYYCNSDCPPGETCSYYTGSCCTPVSQEVACGSQCSGYAWDGCGNYYYCNNTCPSGQTCSYYTSQCCTATLTCASQGYNCGYFYDDCGNYVDCTGSGCPPGQGCGGGGYNVCGCIPSLNCWNQGFNCGSFTDDCGNVQDCGTCYSPETCGGGGTPQVCGCTPTSCDAQGASCGSISDGCGNTLDCGSCGWPQTCTGHVCTGSVTCPEAACQPTACTSECGQPDGCGGILTCGCSPTVLPSTAGATPTCAGGPIVTAENWTIWPNQNLQYFVHDILGVSLVYNSTTQNNLGSAGYYGWSITNVGNFYVLGSQGYRLIEGDGTVRAFTAAGAAADPADQTRVLGLDGQSHYMVGTPLAWRTFDCSGREMSRNTPNPNLTVTFSYNPAGQLAQISDWAHRATNLTYTNGALTGVARYDGTSAALSTTFPNNYPYVNSTPRNLTNITTPDGQYYFSYDWGTAYSLWRAETPSDLSWFLYGYFSANQGQVITAMDNQNHVWDLQSQAGADAGSGQVRYTDEHQLSETFAFYDGCIISDIKQPESFATYFAWDSSQRLIQRLNPASHTWQVFTYNSNNDVVSDASGPPAHVTTYVYSDNSHHPSSVTDAYGRTTTFTYTSLGLPQTVVKSKVGGGVLDTFQFTYDAYGQLTRTQQNGRTTYAATLNALGLPLSATGADGKVTTYAWDANGNQTQTAAPDGPATTFSYTQNDLVSSITDPAGRSMVITRDASGRPSNVQLPNGLAGGGLMTYTRDSSGHVINVSDQSGVAARARSQSRTYGLSGNPDSITVSGSGGSASVQGSSPSLSSPPFPGGSEFFPYLPGFTPDCAGRTGHVNDLTGGQMDCNACASGFSAGANGECIESDTSGSSCGH